MEIFRNDFDKNAESDWVERADEETYRSVGR